MKELRLINKISLAVTGKYYLDLTPFGIEENESIQ